MKGEADGLIESLRVNLQAALAVEIGIEENRFLAEDAAAGINDRLTLVFDHLVGRESGSVLLGNHLVRQSGATFQRILEVTYRMTMAFALRYNLSTAEQHALEERVFQAVTLEEIEALVETLRERERTYCAAEAIDCDAFNNLSVLRVSLRDLLFPELRDLIDPATGVVVTKGQQFHNIITSPPYLRRRVRGVFEVDQIEVPFTIPLFESQTADAERWLLPPTQCNHILDGDPTGRADSAGTLAVNVVGENLDDPSESVFYEVARGHVDQVRACHPEVQATAGELPHLEYEVRSHSIGYAPESQAAQQITPPTFFVRSGELPACINSPERRGVLTETDCWRFFARDRSLAAPDYTLTIPLSIDGTDTNNTWLRGEGLPAAARPVIEDLVVYLRYRSRPISDP
jgi:hypothetical protein